MMETQCTIEPATLRERATISAEQYGTAEDLLDDLMCNVVFDGVPHSLMSLSLNRAIALLELATDALEGQADVTAIEALYAAQAAVRAAGGALEAWLRGRAISGDD